MRILFVSNLYEPYARGGAEVVVKRTIDAARQAGHEVILLTARPWRDGARLKPRLTQEQGLQVYSYYPFNLFFYADDYRWPLPLRLLWHGLDLFNYHSASVMRRILAETKPDLVMTHNLMGLGFPVVAAIRKAGVKHVHILHDIQLAVRSGIMLYGQEHGWDKDGWPARQYQAVVRRQFGSPDLVVSPSQYLLNLYEQLGYFPTSKKLVIRNPIAPELYRIQAAPSLGPFRLLFVGQLVPHKGIDLLQQAFAELFVGSPEAFSLDIVGSGPVEASIQNWAKQFPSVRCHGRLDAQGVQQRLAAADMLVLPTRTYENSPTVIFEALAAGVPVCVSRIGGAAEAVQIKENGLVFEPNDIAGLVQALRTAISEKQHWPLWRAAARKSVEGLDAESYLRALLASLPNE